MADALAQSKESKDILDRANDLIGRARREKRDIEADLREAYKFCMPRRLRPGTSGKIGDKPKDWADIFTSVGQDCIDDFAPDMKNTFTPEYAHWAKIEPDVALPEDNAEAIKKAIQKHEDTIFSEIKKSNFYTEIEPGYKDLGVSSFGLMSEDPGQGLPLYWQVIPLPELLIIQGPRRTLEGRFRQRNVRYSDIKTHWPDAVLPAEIKEKIAAKGTRETEVKSVEGCYRKWGHNDEAWQIVVILDDKHLIEESLVVGPGSCPILCGRWDPDPSLSYGDGIALKSIPDLRTDDELGYMMLKAIARGLDPAFNFDDDGVMNFSEGLESGRGYPRMPGSKLDIIEGRGQLDLGFFERTELRQGIKRKWFQDAPNQRGDTPPTATQWLDESMRTQQRIGSPAGLIWSEFSSQVIMRTAYLLSKQGVLEEVKLNGKVLTLRPINPIEKAERQQDVLAADRYLEIILGRFGQEAVNIVVDTFKTAANIRDSLGVEKIVELRSVEEMQAFLESRATTPAEKQQHEL